MCCLISVRMLNEHKQELTEMQVHIIFYSVWQYVSRCQSSLSMCKLQLSWSPLYKKLLLLLLCHGFTFFCIFMLWPSVKMSYYFCVDVSLSSAAVMWVTVCLCVWVEPQVVSLVFRLIGGDGVSTFFQWTSASLSLPTKLMCDVCYMMWVWNAEKLY